MNTNLPSTEHAILPEILLVSSPVPRLEEFLKGTNTNYIRMVDQSIIEFAPISKYLICLEQAMSLTYRDDPVAILRNLPVEAMQSVHYSFLLAAEREVLLDFRAVTRTRTCTCVSPIMGASFVLGTGSLHDWYETILANSNRDVKFELRFLLNKIQRHLEAAEGLTLVFDNYRKTTLIDMTFVLEKK